MHRVEVNNLIQQIIFLFYRLRVWQEGNDASVKKMLIKLFYSFFYLLFPISIFAGAISSDNKNEQIFYIETGIMLTVLSFKFNCLVWKQKEIVKILHDIGVYSIEDYNDFSIVRQKLKSFMKFDKVFLFVIGLGGIYISYGFSILSSENQLFFKIGFPLDWRNSVISYWIAVTFLSIEAFLAMLNLSFAVLIWYLLLNCGLRYEVLGNQLSKMGITKIITTTKNGRKIPDEEKQNYFHQELVAAIKSYQDLKESTEQLKSFFSNVFLMQIATSGLSICGSIYSLVFNAGGDLMEYMVQSIMLFYNISDILLVMYLGNEIKLSSGRLGYCLFESNWIDQTQSCKKLMIIFAEYLKRPQELVIGKLYPLTLETFNRILHFAYSSFNILKKLR